MPKYLRLLIFVWTLIATSTNIKVAFIPYLDWGLSVIVLFCLLQYSKPKLSIIHLIFLASIIGAGILSESLLLGTVWVTKFTIIFLTTSCLITAPWPPIEAFYAFLAAVVVNAALVVLGKMGIESLSFVVSSYGRMATILNYPGSLWKVGVSCIFYFSYLACIYRKRRISYGFMALVCMGLIYVDGSRTGMIIIAFMPIAICLAAFKDHLYWITYSGIIVLVSLFVVLPTLRWSELIEAENPIARWGKLFTGSDSFLDKIQDLAPDRYEMNVRSMELIKEHPLFGNGLQAAAIDSYSEADDSSHVVTHNGYLQTWANIGLIGLVSFIVIVFAWLSPFYIIARSPTFIEDPIQRAIIYNAIFLLFTFSLCMLFHPISTEWSEWIMFSVPYTLLMRSMPCRQSSNKESFTQSCPLAVVSN